MSLLHTAPWNSSQKETAQWFGSLSLDDQREVVRDVVTILSEFRTMLANSIIPAAAEEEGINAMVRDQIITSLIPLIQQVGMAVLSNSAQALLQQPGFDATPETTKII